LGARVADEGPNINAETSTLTTSSGQDLRSRWMLAMDESKLRYQLHFGLTPIGRHRRLSDGLLNAVTRGCSHREGQGLLESHDLATWKICPDSRGFGSPPFPNSPELKAIRARAEKQYAEAVVAGADDVGPDSLRAVLEDGVVIVHDLQTGAMLWYSA
jgi:hypothetical protein